MTLTVPPGSDVWTNPQVFEMLTTMTLPLGFNAAALLEEGDTVTSAVCTLTNADTGTDVPLIDDPTISGTVIAQIVRGPTQLTARSGDFILSFTFTAAANTIWTRLLRLVVPL